MNRNILPIHILLIFMANSSLVNTSLRATSFVETIKKNKIKFSALGLTVGIIGAGTYTYIKNKLDKPVEITNEALTLRIQTFHNIISNRFCIENKQSGEYIQKLLEYCVKNVVINTFFLEETLKEKFYQNVEQCIHDLEENNLIIKIEGGVNNLFDKELLYKYIAGYLCVIQKSLFPYRSFANEGGKSPDNTPLNLLVMDDSIQNPPVGDNVLTNDKDVALNRIITYEDIVDELQRGRYCVAYQFATTWQLWGKKKEWQLPTEYIPPRSAPINNIKSKDIIQQTDIVQKKAIMENQFKKTE